MDALMDSFAMLYGCGIGLGLVLCFAAFAGGVALSSFWHIIKRG